MKIHPVGDKVFHADRLTEGHDKAEVSFSCDMPKTTST